PEYFTGRLLRTETASLAALLNISTDDLPKYFRTAAARFAQMKRLRAGSRECRFKSTHFAPYYSDGLADHCLLDLKRGVF
ncbi:hypothetical protein, partial [Neisseria sp. P0014.S006]|uniref:hypothetical protein n=1 Tax=Neisseria sp. P0014.S006 TaxID=3436752 RepID=UPI003F806CE0